MTPKERQQRRDQETVWITQALWEDGTWGAYPEMGSAENKDVAMSNASVFIKRNNIIWAKGKRTRFGFSKRIRFRKYSLVKDGK